MRASQPTPTPSDRLAATLGRGPLAYLVAIGYVALASAWLIANSSSTIAFLVFLLSLLVVHSVRIPVWLKAILGFIVLGLVVPYVGNLNQSFLQNITIAAIFVALTLGLNVVVGFAGLLDLGYVAFFAIGAYLWGIFSTPQIGNIISGAQPLGSEWFFLFVAVSVVVAGVAGVLLGLPVLRLRGDYLAIVTLGFGEVIRLLANNLNRPVNITGGTQGITNIGQPPLFFGSVVEAFAPGITPDAELRVYFYALAVIISVLTLLVARRLSTSRIGRAWTAIREDETAAIAMGIPLVRTKLLAFATGASFAGAMGVLYGALFRFISPPTFDLVQSISILSMVILGGMGSIPGAILGAVLVTLLNLRILPDFANQLARWRANGLPIPERFNPVEYQRLFFGLILIFMMIFRPEGILPERRRRQELHEDAEEGELVVEDAQNMVHPDVGIKS